MRDERYGWKASDGRHESRSERWFASMFDAIADAQAVVMPGVMVAIYEIGSTIPVFVVDAASI